LFRIGHKRWSHFLRYGFAAFLILQLLFMLPESRVLPPPPWPADRHPPMGLAKLEFMAWTGLWKHYLLLVLQELFWWIVLLTPAMTAGALGHEKEQGTLLALFGTQLRSSEIIISKLLGHLVPVILPAVSALPLLVMATIFAELSPIRVFLALFLLLVLMVAVAAASMLTAVWTRRTSDAILACYALLLSVFVLFVVFLPSTPVPAWLDPGSLLEQIVSGSGPWLLLFLRQVSALAGVGAICLILAIWRLRPACLRQQEQRSKRWLWAYRRPIGDNPVGWREQHVIGLAPWSWLRIVPTWMGLLGVFTFSAIIAIDSANFCTANLFFPHLQHGNLVLAFHALEHSQHERVHTQVILMGVVLVIGSTIIVGVRCSNSISEEKRRKTWEDLTITPLTQAEIMAGKRRGVLAAAVPAFIVYALPMLGLAALARSNGLVHAGIWVIIGGLGMTGAAFFGIEAASNKEFSRVPLRPKHADKCKKCGGSGLIHVLEDPGHLLCRNCNGLGWVFVPPPPSIATQYATTPSRGAQRRPVGFGGSEGGINAGPSDVGMHPDTLREYQQALQSAEVDRRMHEAVWGEGAVKPTPFPPSSRELEPGRGISHGEQQILDAHDRLDKGAMPIAARDGRDSHH
jgi:ABC-type transport system involved in multi-copper enzyme maturation permease subunit